MTRHNNKDYTVGFTDPISRHYISVTAKLYEEGEYEEANDETGSWCDILIDPEFYDYIYEDQETGAVGIMPENCKSDIDLILCNIYWDRELNR